MTNLYLIQPFTKIAAIVLLIIFTNCSSSTDDGGTTKIDDPIDNDDDDPIITTKYLKDYATFPIGNTVSASALASSSTNNKSNYEILLNEFNSITAGNDMKMYASFIGPTNFDFTKGDAIIAYAKANELRVHGHALIWHPEYAIPNWLENFSGTDQEFANHIENYVKTVVSHFAAEKDASGNSIVTSWDVVNEYFDGTAVRSTLFTQRMGNEYIKKIFEWAREADADVKLFYNDYNIAGSASKRQAILAMVNDFKTNNIPIDGIGMQMHLNHDWPNDDLPTSIEDIANTGLLVHISELDVKVNYGDDITSLTTERSNAQSLQYQKAAYYYTTLVPEEQQFGITIWGIRDQDSWLYDNGSDWPLLYDVNFETKPAYDGFMKGLKGIAP